MKFTTRISLLIAGLLLTLTTYADNDPNKNAIEARVGEMEIRALNAGPLFAMAKGDMPYDAELAARFAENLRLLLSLDMSRAWVPGTDNKSYPEHSEALPELWENMAEVAKHGKAYTKAVNELADVAADGLDSLRAKIGPVGNACKACHDDFKAE